MKQSRRASLCEAATNTVIGVVINWSVLVGVYGQPLAATGVTLAMIVVSSLRLYAVRRLFEALRKEPPDIYPKGLPKAVWQ